MEKLYGKPARIKLRSGSVIVADEATIANCWLHAQRGKEFMTFPVASIVSIVWLDPK